MNATIFTTEINPDKMQTLQSAFFRNATANVVQIAVMAGIGILLPPLLVHHMAQDTYSSWALILQLSAYVAFLDLGLQSAVGHFVAYTQDQRADRDRDSIVSSAVFLLFIFAVAGILLTIGTAWQMPRIFREIPFHLVGPSRAALLIVGSSAALMLPTAALAAIFVGEQRSEIPNGISVLCRLLSATLIALLALRHAGLVWMAIALAVANCLSSLLQFVAWLRCAKYVHIKYLLVARSSISRLLYYCYGMTAWTAGSLLIAGLDMTIVGIVQFNHLVFYSLATTLTLFMIQLQSAVMRALLPTASVLSAREERDRLGKLLVKTTRYGLLLLYLTGIPLIVFARPILLLWVGTGFADQTVPLLRILVAANLVRLIGLPYAMLVVGTNQHNLIAYVPIVEGAVNLAVSIVAGHMLGAIGVALGTLAGSGVSIVTHLLYSMPRTKGITYLRARIFKEGILLPTAAVSPLLALGLLAFAKHLPTPAIIVIALTSALFTGFLLWHVGITSEERGRIGISWNHRFQKAVRGTSMLD